MNKYKKETVDLVNFFIWLITYLLYELFGLIFMKYFTLKHVI